MKKLLFTIASVWMLCTASMKAQITLDFTIDSTLYGYYFYPAKISENETKYVFLDTASNTFSLYNLDMTPFLENISVPHPIFTSDGSGGGYFYHIMYITRSLFDCDSINIEYLFSAQNEPYQPLWIMRTDGTVLFYADSSRGPYCLGCPGGTTILRPILSTESGTKLIIMKSADTINGFNSISVYSLCGTPPVDVYGFQTEQAGTYVEIFPNPSSMQLNFQFTLPDNFNDYELVILNDNSQELKREKIKTTENMLSIDIRNYSSGAYYYSLVAKNKVLQTGKFIITQ